MTDEETAQYLSQFFIEFAHVLLHHNISPRAASELFELAFIRVASDQSTLRNGRINYSRVAARTGFRRASIKQALACGKKGKRTSATPAEKVMTAWCSDSAFVNRSGKPKALNIKGRVGSFDHLVRLHGCDVPARALLDELVRLGVVVEGTRTCHPRRGRAPYHAKLPNRLKRLLKAMATTVRKAHKEPTDRKSASSRG